MKKRITALLLCCVMLLTLCPGLISTATAYDDTQPDQAEATGETVQPTVNFTNVAPFLPPVSGGVRMLRAPLAARAAANFAANDTATDNGMEISKTATRNDDGSYTITLEAYATGEKVISEITKDVPTDIILVLDQSGSMANDIGKVTYEKYKDVDYGLWITYHTRNQDYYECRHNGGSANLWHKLSDDSYVSVSVTKQEKIEYNEITNGRNNQSGWNNEYTNLWDNRDILYALVGGEHVKVSVDQVGGYSYTYTYTLPDGKVIASGGSWNERPAISGTDDNNLYLASVDSTQTVYTYTYTDKDGNDQTIGTSTGATTVFSPTLYERVTSTSGGGTRLDALKNAVTNFANSVKTKAAGEDGELDTDDDIKHRIAVVGFATGDYSSNSDYPTYENTELFIGSNQYNYNGNASSHYSSAFQDMNTQAGYDNIIASKNALAASGATHVDLGIEMANGIFGANPISQNERRNRVMIVFTDGAPSSWSDYDGTVASNAITKANTTKSSTGYGATVYTIGIFSGADATSAGNQNGTDTQKANWFMQQVSSNNGTPRSPSYYLSAADADSLNSIFQQISDQIETGGTTSTLTADAVVKDIISPQFTLPAGATPSDITLETYKYKGTSFDATNAWEKNPNAMSATATVNGDTVSVTGFDFAENWCGSKTNADGSTTYQGNKLVISFKVQPKAGFLGGNDVYTNSSAGVYENGSATDPVLSFPRPQVNVPIDDVAVTAADKNVYLLGDLTAEQLKAGAEVKVGNVRLDLSMDNYGLEAWQTEYVNITVTVKDKGGNVITTDLTDLTDDTTYTVEVTVAPKTQGTSTPEKGDAATAKTGVNNPAANVYVFKPEVNFNDSTIYRGNTADYSNNQTDTPVWKHGNTVDTAVDMIGTAPTLTYTYDKVEGAFEYCTDVNVTVKIGSTDVTDKTTGDKLFTVHVLQPVITATVNDVERYYGESYTLSDGANGTINLTWTDNNNHSGIPDATDAMPYKVNDLSLAYRTTAFSGKTGTVPASDFDVTVQVMKGDTVMPATITTTCTHGCSAAQTDDKYTVHVKTCTLTIKKLGCITTMDANQSFIFDVTGGEIAQNIKVTVQKNGTAKIVGLPVGTYTVTEDSNWSWRYTPDNQEITVIVQGGGDNTVTFHNTRNADKWLSGDSYAVNYVGCSNARGTFVAGN